MNVKKLFSTFAWVLILSCILSFSVSAASKRKLYISNGTYAFSNADTIAIETTLWITNPSSVSQIVYFDNMKMVVYAAGFFNYPQAWYHAWPVSYATVWSSFNASGHNIATGTAFTPTKTSPVTLLPNETLELKLCAKPYLQSGSKSGAFLGDGDFSLSHYALFYGGGDFMGNILVQGIIEVEDASTPGFVIGNGSIVKPASISGQNTTMTSDFVLNAGKPF